MQRNPMQATQRAQKSLTCEVIRAECHATLSLAICSDVHQHRLIVVSALAQKHKRETWCTVCMRASLHHFKRWQHNTKHGRSSLYATVRVYEVFISFCSPRIGKMKLCLFRSPPIPPRAETSMHSSDCLRPNCSPICERLPRLGHFAFI